MSRAPEPDGLLGTRAAARQLGVHENTVRNWAKHGVLKVALIRANGYMRFKPAEVERVAKLVGNLQPRQMSGGDGEFSWWLSGGHVHIGGHGETVSIPYEEWNLMVDRIGHRYPEADRHAPPG